MSSRNKSVKTHPLSTVVEKMSGFQVMSILEAAQRMEKEGKDVIHMEVGQPDFPTPPAIVDAAKTALEQGKTKYTPATGIDELKKAISLHYKKRFDVQPDLDSIVITTGASAALQLVISTLLNPGDGVVLTDPGYPCNEQFVRLAQGRAEFVRVKPENRFLPTLDELEQVWTARCQILLLASPANPTGSVLTLEEIRQYFDFVSSKGGVLVLDEIYHELVYQRDPVTALSISDQIIVINSFSKYYAMTGWRLGWLLIPNWMRDAVDRLAQNLYLAPPTVAQYAALAAFRTDTLELLEQRRTILQSRRDVLWQGLHDLGLGVGDSPPAGAFYIFADVSALGYTAESFCQLLLQQAHVAVTPGSDFAMLDAEKYVRFAYTDTEQRISEALQRMTRVL